MPDEENDIRIREAADNYHPAYDETAWGKMEKLLDEHLPQKKRRKKILFLFPFLLLMGVLVIFMISNNHGKNPEETTGISAPENISGKLNKKNEQNSSEETINVPLNRSVISEKNNAGPQTISGNSNNKNANKPNVTTVSSMHKNKISQYDYDENSSDHFNVLVKQESNKEQNYNNKIVNGESDSSIPPGKEALNKKIIVFWGNNSKTNLPKEDNQKVVAIKPEIKKQEAILKTINSQPEIIKKKTKNTSGFKNNFGVTLSTGPAISGVSNVGKITLRYGAGLSYTIFKKFTIRTGFYMSKKIYSVDPYDYHFPNGRSGNNGDLQSVGANCNVDEIPLNLYYNFGKMKNHNWFISTGLSSYLMRKESYEFYYKTTTGDVYENDWSIKNKNKNIFSVLNLSAGYQHTFNKQFSIMAEPYINLPLSGIGAGKVKLNSGGVLFTIVMKPFLKKGK